MAMAEERGLVQALIPAHAAAIVAESSKVWANPPNRVNDQADDDEMIAAFQRSTAAAAAATASSSSSSSSSSSAAAASPAK
jgi:microcystin-dependent protein